MIRGTTPTHTFDLPFDTSIIKTLRILYAQEGKTVLEKTEADCSMAGNTITLTLSQRDTLALSAGTFAECQIRVLTKDGAALASVPMGVPVGKVLSEEVLT